jgi:ketosteroid isomerase-like protein
MKPALAGWALCVWLASACAADGDDETLRRLDDEERVAILNEDLQALERLMAEDIVVHNPENRVVVGRDAVFERVRRGLIRYSTFERATELVRVDGDLGFVMGGETIVPKGTSTRVHRRYTNVWRRAGDTWKLVARQSTIVEGR